VFSGILPICETDSGIATVLSHEISHNLCHHIAEQMSSRIMYWAGLSAVLVLFGQLDFSALFLADLAFTKPRSRRQESEADQVGLNLMAQSCYDPRDAVPFWQRMDKAEKIKVPEFISTHPSGYTRVEQIKRLMSGAMMKYQDADCSNTGRLCECEFPCP
jgi:metalloendopeptidase OMA1, mitochondrial